MDGEGDWVMTFHLFSVYDENGARYQIQRGDSEGPCSFSDPVVWSRPIVPADKKLCGEYSFPPDVRAKYESLLGRGEFSTTESTGVVNIVELFAGAKDSAFDQPCAFGNRCGGHAVYCHNDDWLYSPRKCRRTWYTRGTTRDEDCPGFRPNPNFKHKAE
jgi:hypothetical protein